SSDDTPTEDFELPAPAYRDAVLLIEQLSLDGKDSVSLLKIQNIIHGYERLIEHETGRYSQLVGKVRKLENEKKELQVLLEEMREMKSMLDHQKVEWESSVNSLKFTLKQEEEKRMSAEMLYEKNREQLKKKEDQYCKEVEEKQQLELTLRSLEMELRTLKNHLKQVEEERNEKQRQLSQEKSARVLQEGILNSHLWRQKEMEEETKKTVPDNREREKDLLHKNQILQDEIAVLRLELDQIRVRHQEEETKCLEENEALKEKNEELKRELKLNEEALTQTVFQYNGQLNVLKTESVMLTSKIEHTKENKDRLEIELESCRSRLNSAVQELERSQTSKNDIERASQRERDEWLRLQDKLNHDLSNLRETNSGLSQQLSKAESKANSLENELHLITHTLREKNLLLESSQRDLSQAQCQAKELEHARQAEKDQMSKCMVKQESMQERLAQLQSENHLLRQQLEDMQNKGIIKEKVVSDVQDRFSDIFSKLRSDSEKHVQMMEERNKELITKCNNLREQVFKYENEKVEREGTLRQLQQELADALKKQSMSEASLEVTTRYRSELEEDKLQFERKKVKKVVELKRSVEIRLDQEMKRNGELQKEYELSHQSTNRDLREQLSSIKILKLQLEEDVSNLKHHVQTNMMDHCQIEQYKREIEERARQEIRQKLEEVNLFLQTQASSQETLEQIRATNNASLRNQLEHRIRDLESELDRIKNTQQDSIFQKESSQTEVERYKELYSEEIKIRKSLASKLDRANERLAEVNGKLIHERHRSKSLIANSFVNGSLSATPVLDTTQFGSLGSNLALNRSLGLGGGFMNPTGNALSSKNRVEAYLAKVSNYKSTTELEAGSVRVSPVGSTNGSTKNLNVEQDPVSKATQQYLDVLKKNYMI
uniref:Ankyrin repeat domain-containing protein 26 n=1 Tax=Sphenodon punctatus TaxID=8508 RepID=A0A8D0HPC0_SPHPU